MSGLNGTRGFRASLVVVAVAAVCGFVVLLATSLVASADDAQAPAVGGPKQAAGSVVSAESATRTLVERPDGTRWLRVSAAPSNFRNAQGDWQPIDSTLVDAGNGLLRNKANSVVVTVPRDPAAAPMSVSDGKGASVAFSLQRHASVSAPSADQGASSPTVATTPATSTGTQPADPTTTAPSTPPAVPGAVLPVASTLVDGAVATTTGVMPGVGATYEVRGGGVKETLSLASANATSTLVYDVKADGLKASIDPSGGVRFRDDKGATRFVVPAPTVADQGGQPTTGHASFALSSDGSQLTLAVDPTWLSSGDRRFPVAVDPSVYVPADGQCLIASGAYANTDFCPSSLLLGYHTSPSAYVGRGLVKFDVSDIFADANVYYAALQMDVTGFAGSGSVNVNAHKLTRSGVTGSATWNKYDGTNAWTTAGGDFDATATATKSLSAADVGDNVSWEMTSLVKGWVDGSTANNGLLLKTDAEGTTAAPELDNAELWVLYEPSLGAQPDQTLVTQQLTDRSSASVNVASGNLFVSSQDISIAGRGLDLNVGRVYNSGDRGGLDEKGLTGLNWTMSPTSDVRLYGDPGGWRVLRDEQGVRWRFDRDPAHDSAGNKAYTKPAGLNANLVEASDGTATLTFEKTNTKYKFPADSWAPIGQIVDRNNNTITLSVDGSDRTSNIEDTRGRDLTFSYAINGDLHQITDVLGRDWTYTTNTDHTLASYQDPDGHTTSYAYDSAKRLKQITDPRGKLTVIAYDSYGRVDTLRRVVDGTATTVGTQDAVWAYDYSGGTGSLCTASGAWGHTEVTDPENHTTTYCFNKQDQVVQAFDPLGHKQATTYTPNRDVATVTSPGQGAAGLNTTYSFNGDNSPTSIVQQTGASSSLTTTLNYDTSSGNTNPLKKYTPSAVVTPKSNGGQTTTDRTLALGYDSSGNLSSVTSAASTQNQLSVAHSGPGGQISSSTDARGNTTTYAYNSDDELSTITPPLPLAASSITYDDASRIHTFTDGKGQTATYTYDGEDRVTRVDYSDSSWVTFTYDNNGNVTRRQNSWGASSYAITDYTYDNLNRITQEARPGFGINTNYTYDQAGNVTSLDDPGGTVTYAYNAANLLTSLTAPDTTTPFTFAYDNDNNRIETTRPNGLTTCTPYDLAGRLQSLKTFAAGSGLSCSSLPSTLVQSYSLTYTLSGGADSPQIQTITDTKAGDTTTYTYDLLDRLTRAQTTGTNPTDFQYTLDGAGNRTQKTQTISGTTTTTYQAFNNANELCKYQTTSGPTCPSSPGTGAPGYDANGNMTSDGNGLTMAYNVRDQMSQYTLPGSSLAYGIGYPGANQQDASTDTPQGKIVLDGFGFAGKQATVTSIYTRDPSGNTLSARDGSNTLTSTGYYLTDPLGNRAAVTNSSGVQTSPSSGSHRYTPDGAPIGTATIAGYRSANNLVVSAGLIHYGYRWYNPALGIWTQQDPISQILDPSQVNPYGYAGGDPINRTDPAGLCADVKGLGGTPGMGTVPCDGKRPGLPGGPSSGFSCETQFGALAGVCKAIKGPGVTIYKVANCAYSLYKRGDATKCNSF